MRSFATRQAHRATSGALAEAVGVCRAAGFDVVIVETAGIGQSDTEVAELVDVSLYVMTSDFGAPTQLEKIGMLDVADLVALNKFEKRGAEDALRDVKKQVQRNRGAFSESPDAMPVFPTMAAQFNDPGVSRLYLALLDKLKKHGFDRASTLFDADTLPPLDPSELAVIPPARQRYLAEIADAARDYRQWAEGNRSRRRASGDRPRARAPSSTHGRPPTPSRWRSAWTRWRRTGVPGSTRDAAPSSITGTPSRSSTGATSWSTPCAVKTSASR